jgi:hypothetical protein
MLYNLFLISRVLITNIIIQPGVMSFSEMGVKICLVRKHFVANRAGNSSVMFMVGLNVIFKLAVVHKDLITNNAGNTTVMINFNVFFKHASVLINLVTDCT